jgi:LemA protein
MKKGLIVVLVLLAIVTIGGCQACSVKNDLVVLDNGVKSKWAEVENQYQRRNDLIGNLVNTVKGAAAHEQNTLTAVIEARAKASQIKLDADDLSPEKIQQYEQAQGQLGSALNRLMVVSEAYPDLKVNENFRALQDELTGTNNRIAFARKGFNDAVEAYNIRVEQVPGNIFAGFFGYKSKGQFKADPDAQKNPEVKF